MAHKFSQVFGKSGDPQKDFTVPIVPTFGNNDVLPHNIFTPGPNRWTRRYTRIWHKFIPQEQVHTFERGGWFFVEVIPNKLAVFSLNTLYFFDSNTAVDGCADKSEPGYEQFEWLRIQLQFFRERGVKAIMTGHVPPARTDNKMSWDETCWHKYAFWMQRYRDVVVGSMYGHMNMDHFMLQDFKDIDDGTMNGRAIERQIRTTLEDDLTIQSSQEYLTDLQSDWADLPSQPDGEVEDERKKSKGEKYLGKIGGEFAERFSFSFVAPSVVPNFSPTMRVIEYNITGLNDKATTSHYGVPPSSTIPPRENIDHDCFSVRLLNRLSSFFSYLICTQPGIYCPTLKPHKPSFIAPLPPPASAPPGPAYSPQPLSWISYTQYFANLTKLNGDFTPLSSSSPSASSSSIGEAIDYNDGDGDGAETQRWHEGKHKGRKPKSDNDGRGKDHDRVKKLVYEVEYDTKTDKIFNLTNLSVRSLLELAGRIGEYEDRWNVDAESGCEDRQQDDSSDDNDNDGEEEGIVEIQGKKKNHRHRKERKERRKRRKQKRKSITELWYTFVKRAFVGSKSEEEIRDHFL